MHRVPVAVPSKHMAVIQLTAGVLEDWHCSTGLRDGSPLFQRGSERAHFLLREYASHLNNQSQAAGSFLNQVCNRGCMYHYFSENFLFLDLLNLQDFFPSPRDEKLKMRNRVNVSFHIIFFVFFFFLFLGRAILSSL